MPEKRVDEIVVGDWIDRDPYRGEIVKVRDHGRAIGDGSVDWRTFRVRPAHALPGSIGDTMGPLRADEFLKLAQPDHGGEGSHA